MKRGRGKYVVLSAVAIAAAVGVAMPTGAKATAGGPMTIPGGVVHGTSGDDLFIVGRDGDFLTQNRFALGDPGFASAQDFDTATDGDQKLSADSAPTFAADLGDGDDTIKFVGAVKGVIANFNMGAGFDTVDFSAQTLGASTEGGTAGNLGTIEKIIGSPQNDGFMASNDPTASPITILGGGGDDLIKGTPGNDILDGGGGRNYLVGMGGDDTLFAYAPLPPSRAQDESGDGNDTLIVRGTEGVDTFLTFSEGHTATVVDDANPNGGIQASDTENVRLQMGGGDDTVLVIPNSIPLSIDGGDGSDQAFVDAAGVRTNETADGGDRIFQRPPIDGVATAPVRLQATVESANSFNETMIATGAGAGAGPHVRSFDYDGNPIASFYAYGTNFGGGVNLALGDVDGDLEDDIVTGAGPGGGPHVRVFHADGSDTGVGFFAYDGNFHGGVNVAAIDLDGDGVDEIVTTPASGGGPHVRVWTGDGQLLDEWFAPGFGNTGLHVARGSVLGDLGGDQIILSAASGSTPLVQVFEEDGTPAPQFSSLNAYDQAFRGGASVARGEFNANATHDEIVTAAGPGGGPNIRVYRKPANPGSPYDMLSSFYAYGSTFPGGVDVATCSPNGSDDKIVTGAGPGGGPHVRVFAGDGTPQALSFFAYDEHFTGGVHVACGGGAIRTF